MSGGPVHPQSNVLHRYGARRPLMVYMLLIVLACAVYLAFFAVDLTGFNPFSFDGDVWDISSFTDPEKFQRSTARLGEFIGSFAHINTEASFIERAWELAFQTLSTALLGTAIAIVCGYLLALGASKAVCMGEPRGPKWLRWFPLHRPAALVCATCRLFLDVLRAVPDFAWAVLIVPLIGIGPMTGMIALAISVTGILGKIYSELWDSVDPQRYENVRAAGAGRFATFVYGIRPLSSRSMLSYTLMRAECAIRNAAVIGAVGGGGVGAEIKLRLDYGEYDKVATMLIFTLALTLAADLISNLIRGQLRTDPNHPRAMRNQSMRRQMSRKAIAVSIALGFVGWSAWYQWQPHPLTVDEPQLERLVQLFKLEGYEKLAKFFGPLMKPELFWVEEQETPYLRTHFIRNSGIEGEKAETVEDFIAQARGKAIALGPPGSDSSNSGPRHLVERTTGKPIEEVFGKVVEKADDWAVMGACASGEADYGAILWDNWGPARKHPVAKAYRPKCEIAFTTEHYSGVKRVNGEIQRALSAARIPVAMAIVGTLIGVLAAMMLCYLHSVAFQLQSRQFTGESPTMLQMAGRWASVVISRIIALVSRGVPEIMWAMFFVAFFGMGVVAGVAALAIHTMGLMTRVFAETVDNIPYRRFEQAFGGSRLATFTYAAAPISWRDWMTYSFFQFESNVRAGVVLGIIGSAGLGFIFSFNFEHFKLEKASTDLLVIILLTIVIDRTSRALKLTRVRV